MSDSGGKRKYQAADLQVREMRLQIRSLRYELQSANDRYETVLYGNKRLQKELTSLRQAREVLKRVIERIEGDKKKLRQEIKRLKGEVRAAEGRVLSLEKQRVKPFV